LGFAHHSIEQGNMTTRTIVRIFTCIAFLCTGSLHFIRPAIFMRIMPPMFPKPLLLVRISGACEIAGAIGLMVPRLRRPAAWGLILLLIAVFPANLYMALSPEQFADLKVPAWVWWVRLPFQAVFIAMVSWAGL
jgi:uncharacterized membrane protein